MCVSCGCGSPDDNHGDQRNITMKDLDQAAKAAGTTRDRVVQNIMSGSQQKPTRQQEDDQLVDRYRPKSNGVGRDTENTLWKIGSSFGNVTVEPAGTVSR